MVNAILSGAMTLVGEDSLAEVLDRSISSNWSAEVAEAIADNALGPFFDEHAND